MIKRALAMFALVVAVSVTMATGASAAVTPSAAGSVSCGAAGRFISESTGGNWTVSRANEFANDTSRFCITKVGRDGFKIDNNIQNPDTVHAYPFDGVGCAYDLCSWNTWLPMKVKSLPGNIRSSFWWTGSTKGAWNTSYDVWFDKHDQTSRQDDGAELMVWLRSPPGYGAGKSRLVTVNGKRYWFMTWTMLQKSTGITWKYLQFRELGTTHRVTNLNLSAFIGWCRSRGYIKPSWWMTSIHSGYELWSGGKGLVTTKFNVVK
jgi:Glycosyl hydrolase family 12